MNPDVTILHAQRAAAHHDVLLLAAMAVRRRALIPPRVHQLLAVLRLLRQAYDAEVADVRKVDEDTYEVRRAGQLVSLSPTEFKLLRYLLLNPERVLSKTQILDHVWEYDFDGKASVVENYISYLRKKVDVLDPPLIHTVRGFGYVLRTEP